MPLQIRITKVVNDAQNARVTFNIIPSGNYTTGVGGDVLDFTQAVADPAFIGLIPQVIQLSAPISLDVWSQGGNIANQYVANLGTALNNSRMKITTAFNTELGTGAYPGSVTGDKICGEAVWAGSFL
jgi:hypothetical protein